VPTTFTDQFFIIDPFSPPPFGTALNFSRFDLIDQNDDGDVDRFDNDSVNGSDVTQSYPGDTVTVNVPGVGNVTYTGITFYLANGTQVFTPTDGQVLQNGTFVTSTAVSGQGPLNTGTDLGPTCFTRGTLIDTVGGARKIECLSPGDQVLTRDNGARPIRWIGQQRIKADGEFAPICFAAGSIGNDKPLLVSPNHRMLITGWQAELYCGEDEMLVVAKQMVNGKTIRIAPRGEVEYFHLLFDTHEIIASHDIWSESFYPGALSSHADRGALREIVALFPDLVRRSTRRCALARPMAKGFEATLLAA
jgi:hypothetical protein